ncbi:MAG: hypothetical protein ACRC8Y_01160 [Chroococcales cyanobacterium]
MIQGWFGRLMSGKLSGSLEPCPLSLAEGAIAVGLNSPQETWVIERPQPGLN